MMNGQQVINTGPQQNTPQGNAAYWVAGWMLIGVLGLLALNLIFRKHTEL